MANGNATVEQHGCAAPPAGRFGGWLADAALVGSALGLALALILVGA